MPDRRSAFPVPLWWRRRLCWLLASGGLSVCLSGCFLVFLFALLVFSFAALFVSAVSAGFLFRLSEVVPRVCFVLEGPAVGGLAGLSWRWCRRLGSLVPGLGAAALASRSFGLVFALVRGGGGSFWSVCQPTLSCLPVPVFVSLQVCGRVGAVSSLACALVPCLLFPVRPLSWSRLWGCCCRGFLSLLAGFREGGWRWWFGLPLCLRRLLASPLFPSL